MKPNNEREETLFRDALQRASGPERQAYLDQVCAGDDALRRRLEVLLQAHESPQPLLETDAAPAEKAAATIRLSFPDEEAVGTRIGRYKLLQKIGEGGMGVVYMAEQEEPVRRRVALKIIKLGMDTRQVVARFEAERQALAMMDHPNIARVLDGGATEAGRPYFVMELVQGVPITDFCDKNKLSAQERLKLFIPVCQAIQSAHQKAIIHRDIKPSNVLVTLNHGEPVPKVIDFGIAKATNQKLTEKTLFTDYGAMIGTPAYMSPEQAEMSSLDVDTRADVYSLGVLLYELLTGSVPFSEKRLRSLGYGEMQRVIMEEEPQRPSTRLSTMAQEQKTVVIKNRREQGESLRNLLKGDLDWIVMKCLEKDRRRRYETANGLARDIERHLASELVTARPPSVAYKFQKAWQRNKIAFTSAAIVAAALIFGISISTWQAIVASRARNAERQQRMAVQTERDKAVTAEKAAKVAEKAEKEARQQSDAQREEAAHNLYIADMNLAQQSWQQNKLGSLRQALEETKDSPYRGFEWYYWQRQAHLDLLTLHGHGGRLTTAAFSPDGRRVVTASLDRTAKVWDAETGQELLTLTGHKDEVISAVYSPDGSRIVTGSRDTTVKLWDSVTGKELLSVDGEHGQNFGVFFSPDGKRLISASEDGTFNVLEADSGRELLSFKSKVLLWGVAISPDGQRIVCESGTNRQVWDAVNGRQLLDLQETNAGCSVACCSDGKRVVTGFRDGTTQVWEAATGRPLLTFKAGGMGVSVDFSPDGNRIVTSDYGGIVKEWDAATGRELHVLKGHSGPVYSVVYSPDGQRIVSAGDDGTAKIWEAAVGAPMDTTEGKQFALHDSDSINHAAFSADGRRIFLSGENCAEVLETVNGRQIYAFKSTNGDYPIASSPDCQQLLTVNSNCIALWDLETGRKVLSLEGHKSALTGASFSRDGHWIATASYDGAKVWDVTSGREVLNIKSLEGGITACVAFSPDGHRIAVGGEDGTAVFAVPTGQKVQTIKDGLMVGSLVFSPDGLRIAGNGDESSKIWDAVTGEELLMPNHKKGLYSLSFSPDGRRMVGGRDDGSASVWETTTGRELLVLNGHTSYVQSAKFSSDGQRIITGSLNDKTARLWEAALPGQISFWQSQEQKTADSIARFEGQETARLERQKALRAHASIRRWLVLEPISFGTKENGANAIDVQWIANEAEIRPLNGDAVTFGNAQLKWRDAATDGPILNFDAILEHLPTETIAYAVCYLRCDSEQRGVTMSVGRGSEVNIYLNGKKVYRVPFPRYTADDVETPDLTLRAGINVLVCKLVKEKLVIQQSSDDSPWQCSVCLSDSHGNPLKGLQVTLNPNAKEGTPGNKP